VTDFALDVFNSNLAFQSSCHVDLETPNKALVAERGQKFYVTFLGGQGRQAFQCSCGRFFDEGIPCQHILAALHSLSPSTVACTLIDPMYLRSRYVEAFRVFQPFVLKRENQYRPNKSVILPKKEKNKPGRKQVRRFPSAGDTRKGRTSTSRRKPQQKETVLDDDDVMFVGAELTGRVDSAEVDVSFHDVPGADTDRDTVTVNQSLALMEFDNRLLQEAAERAIEGKEEAPDLPLLVEPPNTDETSHLAGEEGQWGETRGNEQDSIQLEVEEPVQVTNLTCSPMRPS